jgi:hypothetical protein
MFVLCVITGFSREVDENCTLLFITQQVVVIPYRPFWNKLSEFLTIVDRADRLL